MLPAHIFDFFEDKANPVLPGGIRRRSSTEKREFPVELADNLSA